MRRLAQPNAAGTAEHDDLCLSRIYARYFSFVWSAACNLGVNASDIDDVVQDIFVIAYKRLHTIEQPSLIRSWLYGIARRVVSMHFRNKRSYSDRVRTLQGNVELWHVAAPSPARIVEENSQRNLLLRLLSEVSPEKREAFILVELQGMPAPEVAVAINIPVNTVYSRVRLARGELEAALKRYRAKGQRRPAAAVALGSNQPSMRT